jgi:predicted CXXCH cytochrome family protein
MSEPRPWRLAAVAVVLGLGTGCTDEKVVYQDRAPFNPPPDAASGFLGYYTPDQKQTTCGNCHTTTQGEWDGSAHAGAFATLENSGSAQGFCYGCHTVSERGNSATGPAGWNAVTNAAYHDVQCESCHGPGLTHVENPETTQPIASLAIPPATMLREDERGCADCHSGTHQPFYEEWSTSPHAQVITSAAGRPECVACHRGQDVLEAWGVNSRYVERDAAEHMPITCGVCHDPHGSANDAQLRFPISTVSAETHLCARCHDRRAAPDPNSSHGLEPHAPHTGLLLGEAGWFPPGIGLDPGTVYPTHGTERNAGLCAACHVAAYDVTDAATGDFVFHVTGHRFLALPCVDAGGLPTGATDCGYTEADRSFLACNATGCHAPGVAQGLLASRMLSIQNTADELLAILECVDPGLEDADEPIRPGSAPFTTPEGALYNYNLALFGGGTSGASVHNPFLVEALLDASIIAVLQEYPGCSPRPIAYYEQALQDVIDRSWQSR